MKKVSMEINQRDKRLLTILAAAIIIFLLYNYAISPALINGSLLSEEVQSAEQQMNRINALIEQYPTLGEQEKAEKKKLADKYKMFLGDLNQERILYKLDTLLIESGFNVSSYALTKTAAAQIVVNKPVYTPINYPLLELASKINPPQTDDQVGEAGVDKAEKSTGSKEMPMDSIPTTDLTLSFNNVSYESVMAFLKAVEDMDKSFIVRNISMSKSESGTGGTVVLSLYSLPKLDDADKDLFKFDPVIPKGKVNPFN
jgi:hypothetical protein